MRLIPVSVVLLAGFLAGCSGTMDKVENAANRSYTGSVMGKTYAEVEGYERNPLMQMSGSGPVFGPMIGMTRLTNGMTIYRHIAPGARTETKSNFGGLVGHETVSHRNRLSYFLVGQDGVIKDWATGSVEGTTNDCIRYIGGLIQKCTDANQLQASLALYDIRVLTKDNKPITSWGEAVPDIAPPVAQPATIAVAPKKPAKPIR
ncbi:hypothetical protein [Rhizobium oryzicola]|uniref:Lipoprotein n=1 Tax=Rhizobium oryzicola TaxID=1232668 RepID=A0ABT8SSU3_9HYPH|nr:hypothetical protein [Rhizobium oryzicola]MDO1580943.1 hypothetical protein [Rhizobium oryzicola]